MARLTGFRLGFRGGTMHQALEMEIREWIGRYTRNEITLDAFKEWFHPATWEADDLVLAGDVKLAFAELSEHEEDLKDLLRRLAETYSTTIGGEYAICSAETGAEYGLAV
jgi:metallophosphoesterase superfamily enzyme